MFPMNRRTITVSCGALWLFLSTAALRVEGLELPQPWQNTFSISQLSGKPTLLVFATDWTHPFQESAQALLTDAALLKFLSDWTPVYLDGDENSALVERYQVSAYPTFVILNANGRVTGRFMGAAIDGKELVRRIELAENYGEKLAMARARIKKEPKDAAGWATLGELLTYNAQNPEEYTEAFECFVTALRLDPTITQGIPAEALTAARERIRMEDQAQKLESALKEKPEDHSLQKQLGRILIEMARSEAEYARGVELIKQVLKADPKDTADIPSPLVQSLLSIIHYEERLEAINKQIAASPNDPKLYKQRGDLRTETGTTFDAERIAQGIEDYKTVQRLDPSDKLKVSGDLLFFTLRDRLNETGELDAVLKECVAFEMRYPGHSRTPEIMVMKSLIMYQKGEYASSRAIAEDAQKKYPDSKPVAAILRMLDDARQQMESEAPESDEKETN